MMTEARILDRAGCKVHYWVEGPEDAPVVVLAHGATLDGRVLTPQMCSLATRLRTINLDRPTHWQEQHAS